MTQRTSRTVVTFTRPVWFSALENVLVPGSYTVETDEELIQELSFPAYRRTATFIFLPGKPGSSVVGQVVLIDPLELQAAQKELP